MIEFILIDGFISHSEYFEGFFELWEFVGDDDVYFLGEVFFGFSGAIV